MEDENRKTSKVKAQVKALRSGNKRSILEAIGGIREESEPFIIQELIDLLPEQPDQEISDAVLALLSDLKIQEAVPVIMDCIQDPAYVEVQQQLLSSCWQNGLDYGKYAFIFARLVMDSPLTTAIEALTVFEECIGNLDEGQKKDLLAQAEEKAAQADQSRSGLILSMVKMIRSY